MNTIEVLTKARDLISNKDNWCKDVLFNKPDNGPAQHCVVGAINMVINRTAYHCFDKSSSEAIKVLDDVCTRLFGDDPAVKRHYGNKAVAVNNKMGHDAIILALDTAIGDYPDHAPKEETCERRLANRV